MHCDIASLDAGQSFLVTVEAGITDPICTLPKIDVMLNTAEARSDIYDPNRDNNSDTAAICEWLD